MAFESRREEWEVEVIPKPGETFSRHREEKEQSLKSGRGGGGETSANSKNRKEVTGIGASQTTKKVM